MLKLGRWLHREPAFLHEHEPEHHLEELALMTVAAEWLTRWQPISDSQRRIALFMARPPGNASAQLRQPTRQHFHGRREMARVHFIIARLVNDCFVCSS
jgi:hypothetical protein